MRRAPGCCTEIIADVISICRELHIMRFVKKILGLNKRHKWVKWLRIALFAIALLIADYYASSIAYGNEGSISRMYLYVYFLTLLFAILALIMLGISALLEIIISSSYRLCKRIKTQNDEDKE